MEVHTHIQLPISIYAQHYDPTRTTGLRTAFAKDMGRRFNELIAVVRKTVAVNDALGIAPITHQMQAAVPHAFDFPRSADKVQAFMDWLNQQIDRGILQVSEIQQIGGAVETAWTNKYIQDSYKRGVIRARYELKKAGFNVPTIEASGGIALSMSTPFHLDRVGLLYTRTFSGLKGITTAMDTQISRILAQGIADGDNPILLARKMRAVMDGTAMGDLSITDSLGRFIPAKRRAEMLARTEIIRAHAEAQLQEYQNWRAEGVHLKAEWMTAGDNRVCQRCADLQGSVFTIEEASGMLPLHPDCRCAWLPYRETT